MKFNLQARILPDDNPLFDTLDPSLHGGVSIVVQTNRSAGRDTPAGLGRHGIRSARSAALDGGGRDARVRWPKTATRPVNGKSNENHT